MEDWPARERWRDAGYLRRVAGSRTVPVEVGRHYLAQGWGQDLMPLADFLDNHLLQPTAGTATPLPSPKQVPGSSPECLAGLPGTCR